MSKGRVWLVAVFICCLIIPQSIWAESSAKAGKVTAFSGTAQMKKGTGAKQFDVFKNMSFTQGDTFTTGRKSSLQLLVDANKEVTLSSDTKLVISELMKSLKSSGGKTTLSLAGGKVKVKINEKLSGDSKFNVKTPTAIMGVMGTEFYVYYDHLGTWVGVLEGRVSIDLLGVPGGETIYVNPDESFHMDHNGKWTITKLDKEQEARFYEEEGMPEDGNGGEATEGEEDSVIVYDPPASPGGGSVSPSGNPVLVSADPITDQQASASIGYNGKGQTLTDVYYVNYKGPNKGVQKLQSGAAYSLPDASTAVLDSSYLGSIVSPNISPMFLLEFSSGYMLPVLLPYGTVPAVDQGMLVQLANEALIKRGEIIIPFDQAIDANVSLNELRDFVKLTVNNSPVDLQSTDQISIGGAGQNQLIIKPATALGTDLHSLQVIINAGAVKAKDGGAILYEQQHIELPVAPWFEGMIKAYYSDPSSLPDRYAIYGYGLESATISGYSVRIVNGGNKVELSSNDYTLTGEEYDIAPIYTLQLKPAAMQQIDNETASIEVEFISSGGGPAKIEFVELPQGWADFQNATGLTVEFVDGVLSTAGDLGHRIWLSSDKGLLRPLYMLGNITKDSGALSIQLEGNYTGMRVRLDGGVLSRNGAASPTIYSGLLTEPLPSGALNFYESIYDFQDMQFELLLNEDEVVTKLTFGQDEKPVSHQSTQSIVQVEGSNMKLVKLTVRKDWIEQTFASEGTTELAFNIQTARQLGGNLEPYQFITTKLMYIMN